MTDTLTPRSLDLSIVIPLFNEAENIPHLYQSLKDALAKLNRSYELILVNDGSTDGSDKLLADLAAKDTSVVAITFTRKFKQTAAIAAGLDYASGEIIVCMDGDMQNDPADIGRLLDVMNEGYDVVCGWRKDRHDPLPRVITSRIANGLISRFSGVSLHDYGCTLKAFRHRIIKEVRLYGEMHRFIPIYASWQGAKIKEVPVTHHARTRGKSNYGFERTFKVVLDLMVVQFLALYSTKPIYVFGGFGMFSLFLSLLCAVAAVVFKLIPEHSAVEYGGWHKDFTQTPLPLAAVGFLAVGVQTTLIGLLAEVQVRTYYEAQRKPIYVIRNIVRQGSK